MFSLLNGFTLGCINILMIILHSIYRVLFFIPFIIFTHTCFTLIIFSCFLVLHFSELHSSVDDNKLIFGLLNFLEFGSLAVKYFLFYKYIVSHRSHFFIYLSLPSFILSLTLHIFTLLVALLFFLFHCITALLIC